MQARQTLADIQHLLTTVLKAPTRWQGLAPFADTDGDLAAQVLDEAAKFVDSAIAPLQRSGDEEGCRFDSGQVHTPAGFRDAYQAFWQGGWPALACAPEDGGQGLPAVLECVLYECALVTPVLKAALTDQAFHGASACLQVFGGHGYVREWGIEQIVRDARVAMIYEGTNEIQAIDLLVRKVLTDGGQGLGALLSSLPGAAPSAAASARRHALVEITQTLAIAAQSDPELPYWVADDYLRAVALVLLEWAWAQIGAAHRTAPNAAPARWSAPAQAFAQWVLPEFDLRTSILRQGIAQGLEFRTKLASSA